MLLPFILRPYQLKKQKQKTNKIQKNRSIWVRDWLEKRSAFGGYECTLREFREIDNQHFLFKNYMRMDERNFNELVELTTPFIKKRHSFSESYSGK